MGLPTQLRPLQQPARRAATVVTELRMHSRWGARENAHEASTSDERNTASIEALVSEQRSQSTNIQVNILGQQKANFT